MSAQTQPAAAVSLAADPGVRAGAPAAGTAISGLSPAQMSQFQAAQNTFAEVDSVSGTMPGEPGTGLGPSFNMNSCAGCHAFPAIGGSSPKQNPQIAVATMYGAQNKIPSFLSLDGPVREVRFKKNADGTPDGGVHDLFVIAGRTDAEGCTMTQTDFAAQASANNVSFRVPTPTFGGGLIESIPDAAILANKAANANLKTLFGISGHENRTGNDGTITRFGWKAQNKSLTIFAGEAYHVEQGVTNLVFPNPRETVGNCDYNGHPEDQTDVAAFATFMRLLAPPAPATSYGTVTASSIQHGHDAFVLAGCALCHTESLTTGASSVSALSNQNARLFSDLLVHHMGSGLADGISQGNAGGDEFRTAPLWGLGQRIYFLHDGRTSDLLEAIQAHTGPGSEANNSIGIFSRLPAATKQDVLNFLRSL
ncbi:MAG TPA: di-heme oxidoredictase family protein [Bryobacteraceae bacterium]|nr:di-heme oxidoredictase family protein [Bryobacteraceae bacterium]